MFDIRQIHPRAHDIRKPRARLLERPADIAQGLDRLRIRIIVSDDLARRVGCGRAGNVDDASHAHGA